jgi:GT2 family glycosyltransferase
LETNIGGAGGFYTGMKVARDDGAEWIWIMDDDALPSPIALEELLRHAKPNRVLVPLQQDETGRLHGIGEWSGRYVDRTAEVLGREAVVGKYVFAFVGPLFSRSVINIIGLPECEFFIWFDDIEYALRLQSSDAVEITVIPAAVIRHPSLTNATVAPWKIYYGARNSTHVAIHRSRGYKPLIRLATFQLYALLHDLLFGPQRLCRAEMRMRGLVDGVFGRLGYRVNAVA